MKKLRILLFVGVLTFILTAGIKVNASQYIRTTSQLLSSSSWVVLVSTTQNIFYKCTVGIKYGHACLEITVSLGITFAYLKI